MTEPTWSNWADCAHSNPHSTQHPANLDELTRTVVDAAKTGLRVKCVGAGHSFTPIAVTDGVLISLDRMAGIVSVLPTPTGAHVTVLAGTPLHQLNELLWSRGLAMRNLGDVDAQSVAGAISTGTHGTGAAFTGLAGLVVGLQIVLADGSVVDCSAEQDADLFQAARLGLGAIGVLSQVTLDCPHAFAMHAHEAPDTLDSVLGDLADIRRTVDHFEFYWWPHTRRVLTKRNTRLPGDTPLKPVGRIAGYIDDEFLSNRVFEQSNRLCTRFPAITTRVNGIAARLLSEREYTDRSHRVFISSRRVRFREMEYAVPVHALPEVLEQLDKLITSSGEMVSFPVEVRFAAADDVWMSTANGRESAYIAIHKYWRQDFDAYFRGFEEIAVAAGGRPHWGKLHWLSAAELRPGYTHFDEFLAVRDKLDPQRIFANGYLDRVLG